jgi:hypothetical protein
LGVVSIRFYRNTFDCVIVKVADGGWRMRHRARKYQEADGCFWAFASRVEWREGTGLDVSIVIKLVELHGWRSCNLGEQALNWSKWP